MKQVASRALFYFGIFKKGVVGRELRMGGFSAPGGRGDKEQKYRREAGKKRKERLSDDGSQERLRAGSLIGAVCTDLRAPRIDSAREASSELPGSR
jgi:hypothetical protein